MSESECTPQQHGGAVDRSSQNPKHLEGKSPDDILNELEAKMDAMTDLNYDETVIEEYLAALDEKAPLAVELNVNQSWTTFRSQHAILFEPDDGPMLEKHGGRTGSRGRIRIVLPRLVAVAVIASILCMLCAQAAGIDVFSAIGRWTEEKFGFRGPYTQGEGAAPTAPPDPDAVYGSLQEALDAYAIPEKLAPTWMPDGYEVTYIDVVRYTDQILIQASYNDGTNDLMFNFTYWTEERFEPSVVEKNGTPVVLYEKAGITHYIMSNANVMVAAWMHGLCECVMWGTLTAEQLELMIDSIYT